MLRNILIFSILLLSLLSASNSQLLNKREFRLKDAKPKLIEIYESNNLTSENSISTNNNPGLAGFLSLIVPGAALGQFYKEEFVNGGIRVGISVLCIVWFFASPNFDMGGGGNPTQKLIATSIYVVNWIASIIDAASTKRSPSYRKFRSYNYYF